MDELPISTNSKDDQYQELLERILEEYSLKDEISDDLNEGSIASSSHTEIESKTVKTIFGVFQIYPPPMFETFQLEDSSGYYFDCSTGFYYDKNTTYFYNPKANEWLFWTKIFSTYIPCKGDDEQLKSMLQLLEKKYESTRIVEKDEEPKISIQNKNIDNEFDDMRKIFKGLLPDSDTNCTKSDSNCQHSEKSKSVVSGSNLEPLGKRHHRSDLEESIATKRKSTVAEREEKTRFSIKWASYVENAALKCKDPAVLVVLQKLLSQPTRIPKSKKDFNLLLQEFQYIAAEIQNPYFRKFIWDTIYAEYEADPTKMPFPEHLAKANDEFDGISDEERQYNDQFKRCVEKALTKCHVTEVQNILSRIIFFHGNMPKTVDKFINFLKITLHCCMDDLTARKIWQIIKDEDESVKNPCRKTLLPSNPVVNQNTPTTNFEQERSGIFKLKNRQTNHFSERQSISHSIPSLIHMQAPKFPTNPSYPTNNTNFERPIIFREIVPKPNKPKEMPQLPKNPLKPSTVFVLDLPACIDKSTIEKILSNQGFEFVEVIINRTFLLDGNIKTQGIITFQTLDKATSWVKLNENALKFANGSLCKLLLPSENDVPKWRKSLHSKRRL
uniref:OCRE domain-containing protein n=1 Tax=Acrobeloides nanus TaxID=290746 RepID=A0A914DLU5_9BILA